MKSKFVAITILFVIYVGIVEMATHIYVELGSKLIPPASTGSEWYLRLALYIIFPGIISLFIWAISVIEGKR